MDVGRVLHTHTSLNITSTMVQYLERLHTHTHNNKHGYVHRHHQPTRAVDEVGSYYRIRQCRSQWHATSRSVAVIVARSRSVLGSDALHATGARRCTRSADSNGGAHRDTEA